MSSVKVLIVDDNDDMRSLVRLWFDLEDAIDVVGEATTGAAGIARWRETRPDVVVLDYRMEGLSGLDAAQAILEEDPGTIVLLFSAFLTDAQVIEAHALGVRACVSKDELRLLTDLVIARGRLTEGDA